MQTRFDRQERLHQAIRLMRRIDLDAARMRRSLLAETSLSPADHSVLEALVAEGEMTVPELAAALGLKRQFVQRVVSRLAASGCVERAANPAHRRSFLCRASASGKAFVATLHERELALLNRHIGDINMTEIIVALRVIHRIADGFAAVGAGAPPADTSV
ncbi:MAG: MarR family winged helix-turn-helix transcriptional regulator [Pararhizobium sp.]